MNMQKVDLLFMVEQAIRAPSGHNAQPWLFRIDGYGIEIHPDLDRSLPVVDPDNSELFISLGCATENICIAASQTGYGAHVSIGKSGAITIELDKSGTIIPDPLFDSIAVRQTNRSTYNGRSIPPDTIEALKAIPVELGVNVHFYGSGSPGFDAIAEYIRCGNSIQMQNTAFMDELKEWLRYNRRHQDATNDGLSYAVFGAPNLPEFIVKPIMSKAINERTQNKGDGKKLRSASHLVLFTTTEDTIGEWIALGRTLQRFLLKSTGLGIAHSFFNQPNEVAELAAQMAGTLRLPGEHPAILIRLGYGKAMPYSKRREAEEVIVDRDNGAKPDSDIKMD